MTDLSDSQRPTGSIPNVAPAYWVLYSDNVTWPSTFIYVPGMLYEQYGDVRAIEVHYAAMKKWIDYMKGFLKDDLMPRDTYGDWCVPPESPTLIHSKDPARKTDGVLLGTAYYYDLLRLMARYARLAGKAADSSEYEALAARVKAAFHRKFFDASQGVYGNGTQTSSILPLAFGIAPEAERARVFGNLIRRIEQESKGHVGTGLVGAQWLMRTLSLNGRADVAYEIAGQKSYPGWGYMIEKGATTIWELWNGDTADPAMNSGNHVMQIGDLGVWLFEYLAGIRGDPEQPGFHRALIRPYPVSGLQWVKASHHGMYGRIETQWRRDAAGLALTLTVPPNSTAAVWVPAKSPEAVLESGRPASQAKGVKFLRMDAGAAVFEVESGSYAFLAK
jgi:alpha-L-rhamnosidase